MLPPGPHRPLTPRMPLPASPTSSSRSSAPLFKEDNYSSTSEEESEADAEVTFIHGRSNGTFANHQAERSTSTPRTSDYTTQGDPDASPSASNLFRSNVTNDEFLGTNNFFMPDGSNRQIHQIDNKVFHAGYLENGNNAYLLELPALEKMLNTQKFLMDEMSGQFYAVYGNSYQWMSTKPMLQQALATGELINELAATRQAFGYTGLAGSTPPLATGTQPTASMSCQPDDLLPRQPAPKTVQYQLPSFKLTRLTTCLTMNERIQPPISDEEQQRVPKSTNSSQVKCSKQQPRQQDERLCFYCNQQGHLKRNCPEIPYCSQCRMRGHTPDRCTSKPQRNRHTCQTGESRDQQKRNEDLPQFSSPHNRCLHCAGDHQTANCTTTLQQQAPTTNSPASGTGTSIHQNAPNTSHSSSHSNAQSPASRQHSQSTLHVQMPTLNINAPQFQSNLHQAPPPPLAQNNQSTNYHTNQQQMHTPPTQPFTAQLPQSFNPHVPPPYFPQYPPTNSPSAHSTDSSILLALQKQWERQERIDMECNEMEKQKEERKRMKEEREQRKEDRK